LEIIKDRAVNVIAGEPDGGNHSFSANDTFKGHNWHEICKGTGVDFTKVNLSKLHSVFVEDNNIREESEGSSHIPHFKFIKTVVSEFQSAMNRLIKVSYTDLHSYCR
jgi:hypothetical protein